MSAKKDSYWFRHDSSAGRGLKIRTLQSKFKHWGKGIYWDIVEVLRDQKNYVYEYSDDSIETIRQLINCDEELILNDGTVLKYKECFQRAIKLELFLIDEKKGVFYCPVLSKNMKRWESSKGNGGKGGRPVGSKNKKPKKNPTDNPNSNPAETIREEKKRKDNSIEENKIYFPDNLPLNLKYIEWVKYRADIRKKMNPTTIEKQLKELSKFPTADAIFELERAMKAGWTGYHFDNKKTASAQQHLKTPENGTPKFGNAVVFKSGESSGS